MSGEQGFRGSFTGGHFDEVVHKCNLGIHHDLSAAENREMPRRRARLPPLPHTFAVNVALSAGVTRGALRNPSFLAPFHGVRSFGSATSAAPSLRDQTLRTARLFLPRLREGEAASHTSALLIHGCPLHVAPELHVTAQPPHTRTRALGAHGHEWDTLTPTTVIDGVPVALPLTALVQSAHMLPLIELVVTIDHLLLPRGFAGQMPALVGVAALRHRVQKFRGRGTKTLRLAVDLARVGAESRIETLTRLMLHAYGLADSFELQAELHDDDGWIGRFDLVDRARMTIVEFDGDQHRTSKAQYEKDIWRLDRARAAGYRVIRIRSNDVVHRPHETAARIALALGLDLRPHPLASLLLVKPA